jgi:hypothetical protein
MHLFRLLAISSPIPGRLVGTIRTFVDAIRYMNYLLKQLPMQPLVAALVISLVLGAIPMMLTALYSVARIAPNWLWQAFRWRPDGPVIGVHSHKLTNQLELL